MTKLYKILFFIRGLIKFVFLFDRKETLLLLAQDGNAVDQLELANYLHSRSDYMNAFAWAEVARFQGLMEAEGLKVNLWNLIPDEKKFEAQTLARNFRINYTKRF